VSSQVEDSLNMVKMRDPTYTPFKVQVDKTILRAKAWRKTTGVDCHETCPQCYETMYPFDCRLDKNNTPVCKQCSRVVPRVGFREACWEKKYGPAEFDCPFECGRIITYFNYELCRDKAGCLGGEYKIKNCFVACTPCNRRQGTQSLKSYEKTLSNISVIVTDRLIGSVVKKWFSTKYYYGEIVSVDEHGLYSVKYDDGDHETLYGDEVEMFIVDEDPWYRESAYIDIDKWFN